MRGTMRERPPGSGVWEIRAYIAKDPITGKPRQVSRTVRGGKRVAQKALAALVVEAEQGKLGGTNATMAVLFDDYLKTLERKGLSPTTVSTYREVVTTRLKPAIGKISVRKLTSWDLDRLYAELAARGMSPATIRKYHSVISGALSQAQRWGWCPVNVARMATPPARRPTPVVAPTINEVKAILEAADQANPTLAALIGLAALTGARRGELCALRWSDVNLLAGTLTIARAIYDVGGQVGEKDTKTHAVRRIGLGDAGVALLTTHRQRVLDCARQAEAVMPSDAFVFSTRVDGTTPYRPSVVSSFFGRVRDELGLRHVHLHSLRHFVATELAARGDVSVRTIAGRLGHASPVLTLQTYSHFFEAADAEAANHLSRALNPPTQE